MTTVTEDLSLAFAERGVKVKPARLETLASMLKDDETVVAVCKGSLGRTPGHLVLTDQRLVCVGSALGILDTEVVALANVTSVKYRPMSSRQMTLNLNRGAMKVVADRHMSLKIQAYV